MEYGLALERAGDMGGAVDAYHRERKLSNELFETRRQKAVLELQGKYEADKKERQIELLSRENQVKSAEIDNRRLQQRVWWLLAVVFALASVIVGILYRKVRHANAQLQVKNLELKQQSSRDPLTSLYNRRHFQEFMRTQVKVDKRGAGAAAEDIVGALFLLDVDHFKHVNDTYGHAAGDAVLTMISENLREILRETDMIVRWGGEEFLAFLPAIPRSGVEEIARAAAGRDLVERHRLPGQQDIGERLDRLRAVPAVAGRAPAAVGARGQPGRHGAVHGQGPRPQPRLRRARLRQLRRRPRWNASSKTSKAPGAKASSTCRWCSAAGPSRPPPPTPKRPTPPEAKLKRWCQV